MFICNNYISATIKGGQHDGLPIVPTSYVIRVKLFFGKLTLFCSFLYYHKSSLSDFITRTRTVQLSPDKFRRVNSVTKQHRYFQSVFLQRDAMQARP